MTFREDSLCNNRRQAAINRRGVHVSVLIGDQQRGLGLPLKQICAGFHKSFLHIPIKVGVFWLYVSVVDIQTHD